MNEIKQIPSPVTQSKVFQSAESARGRLSVETGQIRGQGALGRIIDWIKGKLNIGSADRAAAHQSALSLFKQEVGNHYAKLGVDAIGSANEVSSAVRLLDRKVTSVNEQIKGQAEYFKPGFGRGFIDLAVSRGLVKLDSNQKPIGDVPTPELSVREAFEHDFSSRLVESALAGASIDGDFAKRIAVEVYESLGIFDAKDRVRSENFVRDQFSFGGDALVQVPVGIDGKNIAIVIPNAGLQALAEKVGAVIEIDSHSKVAPGAKAVLIPSASVVERLASFEAAVADVAVGGSRIADAETKLTAAFQTLVAD